MKKYFGFYYLACRCLITISQKSSIVSGTMQNPREKEILTLKVTDMKNHGKNKSVRQLHKKYLHIVDHIHAYVLK